MDSNEAEVKRNDDNQSRDKQQSYYDFLLPLPLEQAVKVLEMITSGTGANIEEEKTDESTEDSTNMWDSFSRHFKAEEFNMKQFEKKLIGKIKERQSHSAFIIIRSALSTILDLSGESETDTEPSGENQKEEENTMNIGNLNMNEGSETESLKLIGMGLFYATIYESLKDEAVMLLEGLVTHLIVTVEKLYA